MRARMMPYKSGGGLVMAGAITACHAKAHLGKVGREVSRMATEVHGGMAFTDEPGLHY
jgi:alkylation response protein AidB-like acyl-CoA dehydrogenase